MAQGNTIFYSKYSDENWKPIEGITQNTSNKLAQVAYMQILNVLSC